MRQLRPGVLKRLEYVLTLLAAVFRIWAQYLLCKKAEDVQLQKHGRTHVHVLWEGGPYLPASYGRSYRQRSHILLDLEN